MGMDLLNAVILSLFIAMTVMTAYFMYDFQPIWFEHQDARGFYLNNCTSSFTGAWWETSYGKEVPAWSR